MGTPILDVFNFSKSYFCLGTRSHKQVTCDALWEPFKMADNRKLKDAKQHFTLMCKQNCSGT